MSFSVTEICRYHRTHSTPAEDAFWQAVRNRQVLNKKFNRQFPVYFEFEDEKRFFIADFHCNEYKLIVEIDGGIHETQKDYDKLRTHILKKLNYTVIRFKNEEVLNNIDQVLKKLKVHLNTKSTLKNSSLLFKEKGGGMS